MLLFTMFAIGILLGALIAYPCGLDVGRRER